MTIARDTDTQAFVRGPETSVTVSARRTVIIAGLLLVLLLAALDSTIVATALPTIVGEFGGLSRLSWVVTAYLLAQTVVTPLYGKLGDLYGRKRVLQSAIVLFLLGSMLCGISQSLMQLIIFRAVQGLGGGGLIVSTQAVIGDIVSPRDRGRYQGLFGAVFGLASVAGPLLGGYFTTALSWRWIFFVNLPLGVLAMAVIGAILPAAVSRKKHEIDYSGAAALAVGLSGLVLALDLGGNLFPWSSPTIIGMLLASIVALVGFVAIERRAREPILPPSLFGNRVFAVCASVALIVGFALFGSVTYMPLYLQVVQGSSPTRSGLELLPMMGGMFVTSIASGQLISRKGRYRIYPIVGTAISTCGLLLLSRMDVDSSRLMISMAMLVLGLGLGLVMQVLVLAAQNAVEYRDLGVATSGITLFRSVGGSLGTAVLGAIFASSLSSRLAHLGDSDTAVSSAHSVDLAALSQMSAAARSAYLHAFTGALGTLFIVAACIAAFGFLLTWFLEERALRETVAATAGTQEAFPMPTDDDSMRQLSQGLWVLLNRDAKRHLLSKVAARAQVSLTPAAAWLLMRADHDSTLRIDKLASDYHLDVHRLKSGMDLLLAGNYLHSLRMNDATYDVVVTPDGRATVEALYSARESLLSERLREWKPSENTELSEFLQRLAHDIEMEVPT